MEKITNEFDPILDEGEEVIAVYKPNKARFFTGKILSYFFLGLWICWFPLLFLLPDENTGHAVFGTNPALAWILFALILVLPLAIAFPFIFLHYRHVLYGISGSRLLIKDGVIGVDYRTLELKNIGATDVNVGLVDKIIGKNTGTLSFGSNASPMTGNGRNGINVYRFVNVVEPYVVLKNIKSAIEKSKGE